MKINNLFRLIVVFSLGNILKNQAQEKVNILDSEYYGFEVSTGDDGWWMQQPENWSIVTNKGADGSSRSLKYTNDASFTGSKKAFGSSTISEMLIALEAGNYDLKTKVWVETGANISAIKVNFRTEGETDVNVIFDLSTVAKDQWVELSIPFETSKPFVNTNVRLLMDASYGGIGTLYVDDLQLLVNETELPTEVPLIGEISTTESENLYLSTGSYEVSLQVWIESETTIPSFYTQISEPWISTEWEIEELPRDEWVGLKKEFVLNEKAENIDFKILVSNFSDDEAYKGSFYVDAIVFKKIGEIEEVVLFDVSTVGESCQGKNNGQININAQEEGSYYVLLEGVKTTFSRSISIENLNPGDYDFKIGSEESTTVNEYVVNIIEAKNIEVHITSQLNNSTIVVNEGTAPYTFYKNGNKVQESMSSTYKMSTEPGDLLEVKTALDCEGVFSNRDNGVYVYPNPADSFFNVYCPKGSRVKMYNSVGSLIQEFEAKETNPRIDISEKLSGVYYLEILTGSTSVVNKVVVK
ncbi:T9SS type A sorting domain-containing protein [Wenyingzhuangia sp. 1_MG-2023]|nr:T9SS type A sorting domain-containing protein [Wenyingzhuangia sp. 1_MG-2023]